MSSAMHRHSGIFWEPLGFSIVWLWLFKCQCHSIAYKGVSHCCCWNTFPKGFANPCTSSDWWQVFGKNDLPCKFLNIEITLLMHFSAMCSYSPLLRGDQRLLQCNYTCVVHGYRFYAGVTAKTFCGNKTAKVVLPLRYRLIGQGLLPLSTSSGPLLSRM